MSTPDRYQRPPLRYKRFGGGYRREDVEFALAELRLTLRQLDNDLETLRDRNRELEGELAAARTEIESFRAKEHELSQTMAAALRRATEIEEGANARAREIIAQAEEAAMRIRSEASRRIEDSSAQFNELLRLKDNLLDAMRTVVGDFDHAITRVERGEQLFPGVLQEVPSEARPEAPAEPRPPAAPWPVPAEQAAAAAPAEGPPVPPFVPPVEEAPPVPAQPPAARPEPTPEPAAEAPAAAQVPDAVSIPAAPPPAPPPEPPAPEPVAEPTAAAAPPPPPPAPPPPPEPVPVPAPPEAREPAAEPPADDDPMFETRVELDAGPFTDFAALSAFERALAHLPKVEDVYVRRLADDRALIELTLSEVAPLLRTMHETLPYALDVKSVNRSKIVVNVAVQTPAGAR